MKVTALVPKVNDHINSIIAGFVGIKPKGAHPTAMIFKDRLQKVIKWAGGEAWDLDVDDDDYVGSFVETYFDAVKVGDLDEDEEL